MIGHCMRHSRLRSPLARAGCLALLLVLWPHPGDAPGGHLHAQVSVVGQLETRSYHFEPTGEEMEYALFVPGAHDGDSELPLVVLLHGLGSTPGQVMRYEGILEEAEARGYLVVAPMGYNRRGWYGSVGPGREARLGARPEDPENLGELSELDVMNVLERTLEGFPVDRDRIFLMGHSMGGGGTLHLAMTYPDIWAGLAPVASAIYSDPTEGARAIRHLSVILLQGTDDDLVPVTIARAWAEAMAELDMNVRYIEVEGGDHTAIISRTPRHVQAIFDFFDGIETP